MALILAINPGNSHSPTLARLARELPGHELVGADSCAVALNAIRSRVPDLVLLPDKSARGEAELLAQLRVIRGGGVPTRKLPPVATADPATLAKEIRAIVTREPRPAPPPPAPPPPPVPAGPSPHVVAAAQAAVTWIHARRAQWEKEVVREPERRFTIVERRDDSQESEEPEETREADACEPVESDDSGESPTRRVNWLPRAAAGAALVAAAAAGVWFWPQIAGNATTEVVAVAPPLESAPSAAPGDAPGAPASGATVPGLASDPGALAPAAVTNASPAEADSGWIVVTAPFAVTVTRGSEAVSLDPLGRAVLDSGTHRLRFRNREMGYDETRTISVQPTGTTTIALNPETIVSVTATETADVLVDGTRVGATPFEGRMQPGRRTVTVRNAGGERQFIIEATMKPVQIDVDFSKP